MRTALILALIWATMGLQTAFGAEIDLDRLATAIWRAEGGAKTKHPYGILKKYKTTTPRQACINTIKSGLRRYKDYKGKDDFITFLGMTYCPTEGNKLTLLEKKYNVNWVRNVKYFYNKGK